MARPMGFEAVTFTLRERCLVTDRVSPSDRVTIAQTISDWRLARKGRLESVESRCGAVTLG
jgi:hypothetical protein